MSERTRVSVAPGRATTSFGTLIVSLAVVELCSGAVQTYFSPVLRLVAERYGVSLGAVSWAQLAPTLALVVVTPVLARMGDLHGQRRMLRVAAGLVAVGSVVVALAPSFTVLLVGRAMQGCIGAFLPLMLGLLGTRHPGEPARRGVGYLCAVLMVGALAGTTLSGPLATESLAWPLWALAACIGCGLLLLFVTDRVPEVRSSGASMDWPGAVLLSAGLLSLVLGIDKGAAWGYRSTPTLAALALAVLLLAAWTLYELRATTPLMDIRYLFRPRLVPIFAVGFLMYFAFLGSIVPNSTYLSLPKGLGYGMGLDAGGVSLALVLPFLAMALTATGTSRVGRHIGYPATVSLGCGLFAVGAVGLWALHGSLAIFLSCYTVVGAGFGFVEGSTRTVVLDALGAADVSVGVGIYELSIGVGAAIGTAVCGAVLTAHITDPSRPPTEQGYAVCWAVLAAAAVLGAAVACWHSIRPRSTETIPTTQHVTVDH